MGNPFNQLNPRNPMQGYDFNQIRGLYQSMRNGMSPMQMLGQMANGNPQIANVVNALRMGGNPKALYESMCQQRGINPQEFMRNITGNNGR